MNAETRPLGEREVVDAQLAGRLPMFLTSRQAVEAYKALLPLLMEELVEECAEKHCGRPPTLGMTIRYSEALRVEVYLCEEHFDALDEALGH